MTEPFSVFHNGTELHITPQTCIRIGAVVFRILHKEDGIIVCEPMLWNREDTSALQPYGIKNPYGETAHIPIGTIAETLLEQNKRAVAHT